ncbi:MAG: cbb3-type cytochrome c oxidase subunit II, partial [Gammaproteobacteria bacterium]|nr:cbb3-type cytochrome c oxidase subunit II [Gammaproteobacteria bacterium]
CHSQYVRPVTGESRRWGPVSQSGEYAFDLPHMFSTRRIGPDLTRVGLKYSDGWHIAHLWNPRMVVTDSIMPSFPWLFARQNDTAAIVDDADGNRTLAQTAATKKLFDFSSAQKIILTPNAEGLVFVAEAGRYPVILTPNEEFTGNSVQIIAMTDELKGLVAYLQKLGTNRGKWRDLFAPQRLQISQFSIPRSDEWIEHGQTVYQRRCIGCHGEKGDGNGPAASFLTEVRPRNFTAGTFKFRLTPSGSLPSDGDLMRTITQGLRGTAMPSFHMLPEKDRLAVIQYLKYQLTADDGSLFFVEEEVEQPMYIAKAPSPSTELIAQGKEVWRLAKCWECHGDSGKGDGEKALGLEDDWGFPAPPADLTAGLFKSGPAVEDIFRTLSTGLSGTPMPSYSDTFSEEDRWAMAYFVLSLSAYTDPLSKQPLAISEETRAALNNTELKADSSRQAYQPPPSDVMDNYYAGEAWAEKHGITTNSN